MCPKLDNKLVVKNAFLLTLRMIIASAVGLYTSRIVLTALGVDDYGLYGLVGGLVGMVNFLNGAMGGATSRFITFELGKGNNENLRKVFSTSLYIHSIIAIIGIVVAEIVGMWMINSKLVIPQGSIFAAHIVFQLSVLSIAVNFTQVPYSAVIMAHERMGIYAYFELINVFFKLGVAYLLLISSSKRLILYAVLNFIIAIIIRIIYRLYCVKHFQEAKSNLKLDKKYAKEMLTFSGFDLYGNLSVMVYIQGLPIILNMFLGLAANAASNIGTTITGVAKGFAWSVSNAFIPQITKQYAAGNIRNMESVMFRSIQFTALTFAMTAIPFIVETERILYLWLNQIPDYTVIFVRFIMLVTIIDYLTMANNRAIHATGKIKGISLISGSFYLISPFVSYIVMKLGGPAYSPYLINAGLLLIVTVIGIVLLNRQIKKFNITSYIVVILKTYGVISLSLFIMFALTNFYSEDYPVETTSFFVSLKLIIITTIIGILLISFLSYYLVFNHTDRILVKEKFRHYANMCCIFCK